jgi:UDP-glucuronate decarboxylase
LAVIAGAVGPGLERLRGKTVLLTGGTGFIGTWLLETLSWLNDHSHFGVRVYVPTRSPSGFIGRLPQLARRDIVLLHGDVRSFVYPNAACDFVIHAAAPADPRAPLLDGLGVASTIADGTRHVLDLADRLRVESCLFVSSGAVYGTQPPDLLRLREDYLGAPDIGAVGSAYSESKRYAESLCAMFRHARGVPVRVARPFTFAGPYQDLNGAFAVTDFIRCCLSGEPIRIRGDGTAVRSFCYAADLVVALLKILLDGEPGSVFNVGAESEVSIAELAHRVSLLLGSSAPIIIEGVSTVGRLPARYVPDTTQLRERLNFGLRYDLSETLARSVRWARDTFAEAAVEEPRQ